MRPPFRCGFGNARRGGTPASATPALGIACCALLRFSSGINPDVTNKKRSLKNVATNKKRSVGVYPRRQGSSPTPGFIPDAPLSFFPSGVKPDALFRFFVGHEARRYELSSGINPDATNYYESSKTRSVGFYTRRRVLYPTPGSISDVPFPRA